MMPRLSLHSAAVVFLAPLAAPAAPPGKSPAPITAVTYSPDGKTLLAGGKGQIAAIDPANGQVRGIVKRGDAGKSLPVTALAYSRDGKQVAAALGEPQVTGKVILLDPSKDSPNPDLTLVDSRDVIYGLAFAPDGKFLATAGYERLVKLWPMRFPAFPRELKDHSDAVYGLAFSPDGKLLASAGADRAVKVWEVASGKRLYTLADATDWVYAVAWSPDGKRLAAAGVDKSIRVWEADAGGGRLVHSVFAHEGPVLKLAYSDDGTTLFSLSEDRTAKAWDAAKMVERRAYDRQPESVLTFAARPDGKQLALARYDGQVVLLDAASGKPTALDPFKPQPAQPTGVTPAAVRRGADARVTVAGKNLDGTTAVTASTPGVTAMLRSDAKTAERIDVDLTVAATVAPGPVQLRLDGPGGPSAPVTVIVDRYAAVNESQPNESPRTAPSVKLPATLVGSLDRAGDTDFFRFEAAAGQQLGAQVIAATIGSKLDPVLALYGPDGEAVAESVSGVLGHVCEKAGTYALGVRDREYRGGKEQFYRLNVGDVPVVTGVSPAGVQRGRSAHVAVRGVNLGRLAENGVEVKVPADAQIGGRVPVPVGEVRGEKPLGDATVIAGEFPEHAYSATADVTAFDKLPATMNGVLSKSGADHLVGFRASKGERLIIEVSAQRTGSPLDPVIEVLDAGNRPVPRAALRCVSQTYSTFRDHDSFAPGIRLETWNDLAIDDYLFADGELMRIRALPRNPDDDCQFYALSSRRKGFLDTTPRHHSFPTALFKVQLHPPGSTFPPNGLPVYALTYRNDDGTGIGKDARLTFEVPADGDYRVRVSDARGEGGPNHYYRLTVRPPRPDFTVRFNPTAPAVWKGGAVPVTVTADRSDGFDGPIRVALENLPAGLSAPATFIEAGQDSTALALSAEPGAVIPPNAPALKLVARADVGGKEVVREAAGGVPKVQEPGDIVTTVGLTELAIKPGQETKFVVAVERRNGFKGRIPLDVRGLPHGVRVLHVGLNGILVTERDTSREVVLYAEPWVQPMAHPIVVLATREGKGTEHAAKSVLLKVEK